MAEGVVIEINEAFAVVPMVSMRTLGIGHDELNVHGGTCALGRPVSVAAICIGGGETTAIAIERSKEELS